MSRRLLIDLGADRKSVVLLGADLLSVLHEVWEPRWRQAAIIGDERVMALYGEAVARALLPVTQRVIACPFPPGEDHKTRATKQRLEDQLLDAGLDRHGCVVGLGGGISLDVAGFVAATYLRGIDALYVPTSLLAQVDAAVGGKTGVNTRHGKNLIGAFHQPQVVLVDSGLLKTLPPAEWVNGLAELVKHAVIADPELFGWLEAQAAELTQVQALDPYPLSRCVEIKAEVVCADEREAGLRSVLNFGHTVGHALEAASGFALRHGEAVAVGMVVEARLAVKRTGFAKEELQRLVALLTRLGLPTTAPALAFDALCPWLGADKKRRGEAIQLALPRRIGAMAAGDGRYTLPATKDELAAAWGDAP